MADGPRRRRLEVEEIGDIAVVNFIDKKILDEQNIQMIGDDLFRLVDELGRRKVLLNFQNVEFMSSAALGKLITLHRKLQQAGGKLVLCKIAKDILDVRDLFTTRVCLGVTTASHVDMVLGDGARDRGALADEIPGDERHAGIGFTIDPITRLPVRFRAAYVTDPEIDELARECTPWAQPGDVINLSATDQPGGDGDGRVA